MKVTAYRITKTKYSRTAFDGEGASENAGRWNSVGTRMVYTASSLCLATLEMLVHTQNISVIYSLYTVIPIEFDSSLIIDIDPKSLPSDWCNPEPVPATKILGDAWIGSGESVLLKVPSAVTKIEFNFLLNPVHPDFAQISIGPEFAFEPDPRFQK